MTVNHDVVGSSPTGGVFKRSKERFFLFYNFFRTFIFVSINAYFVYFMLV